MGNHNILIVADSGHHKTWFLSTCPKPFIYDFDKGLQTADMESTIPHATFRDLPRQFAAVNGFVPEMEKSGLYKPGEGWLAFIKHLNEKIAVILAGKDDTKTLCLDSLSFMQELAMSRVVANQVRLGQDAAQHKGSYGDQQRYIKDVLNVLTVLPINVVATAHIQRDENDLTKITEKLPLLTGKLAGFIGAFFQEVWFVEATEAKAEEKAKYAPHNMKFIIHNRAVGMDKQSKTRKNIPDGTELDWAAVAPYLEGKDKSDKSTQVLNLSGKP